MNIPVKDFLLTQHKINILEDNFSRKIRYVRLSLTDLCNFKCEYCLPNGYQGKKKPNELNLEEIYYLAVALKQLGVQKIRLTGGEPSLRKDLTDVIHMLKHKVGIQTVALTTNGYQLNRHLPNWINAGLDSINISVDSFDRATFQQFTGVDALPDILQGIQTLVRCYPDFPIHMNSVLFKHTASQHLQDSLALIKHTPVTIRFIELMETKQQKDLFFREHLSGQTIQTQLHQLGFTHEKKQLTSGPAEVFSHADYVGKMGLIMPYANHFCDSCNRIRISSQGNIHFCLYDSQAFSIRDYLAKEQVQQLPNIISNLIHHKPKAHHLHESNSGLMLNLSQIGG